MAQGTFKKPSGSKPPKKANSAKLKQRLEKAKQARKGQTRIMPNNSWRDEAMDNHSLSKAIDKKNEKIIASKVIQSSGKLAMSDLSQKGKEGNKERRKGSMTG